MILKGIALSLRGYHVRVEKRDPQDGHRFLKIYAVVLGDPIDGVVKSYHSKFSGAYNQLMDNLGDKRRIDE